MISKLFKDIVTLQRGYDLPTQKRVAGNYPLMSSSHMDGSVSSYKVKGPGVITGRSGTIGEVLYTDRNYWPLNTTLYVSDFRGNNPKYIYYWLSKFPLSKFSSGTSVPTLDRNDLFSIKTYVNELKIQEHIVDIIGSIDEKMTINKVLIENYSNIVSYLYSYMTSQSHTDSVVKLGDVIEKNRTIFSSNDNAMLLDLSNICSDSLSIENVSSTKEFKTNLFTITKGTLFYGSIRPYLHKSGICPFDGAVTGTIHTFKTKKGFDLLILGLITSSKFHDYAVLNSQGTKMPVFTFDSLKDYKFFYSSTRLKRISDFNCIINEIILLNEQNLKLKAIKKTLLPLMLNEQVF